MYALVVDNICVRQDLVAYGLNVDGIHLDFKYHKMNGPKVYVSNVPCGVSSLDIQEAFKPYGIIREIKKITKFYYGYELDTGDRIITFETLIKPIPSYVAVRGWWAYVKYRGQAQTCRYCEEEGHIGVNCPKRNGKQGNRSKPEEKSSNEETVQNAEPVDMDVHKPPSPKRAFS